MAWLHSTPKDKAKDSRVANKEPQEKKPTRAEKIEANGGVPLLPDVGDAAYLVIYWQQAGMFSIGSMGPVTLTSVELLAWQSCSGVFLAPWEFQVIRDMSRAYVSQLHESEAPQCPPPHGEQVYEFDRDVVSKKVANAFKAFSQARKR